MGDLVVNLYNSRTSKNAQEQETTRSLGAFKTSKALLELHNTAAPHLSKAQLELMTRAKHNAQLQAENLSSVVEYLGLLILEDERDDWGIKDRCPQLLWQLSYEFNAIAGMIQLGEEAEFRLRELEQSKAEGGAA